MTRRRGCGTCRARPPPPLCSKDHRAAVISVAFSPGGRRVVTGSRDRTARVWDLSGAPPRAESARGVSPRAAHRSGLDTLASSGSCHRTKAAASRRELELLLLPVGSLPTSVTCPLRSTGITPLPRYYGAVRPYPPHRYFRPHSFAACTFSLGIAG